MVYRINKNNVSIAIVKVGIQHKDWWASANYSNLSDRKRIYYMNKLLVEILKYLKEKYKYSDQILERYKVKRYIIATWTEYFSYICRDIDGTIV